MKTDGNDRPHVSPSGFKSFNYRLLRYLLHAWIEPKVINADPEKLQLDPGRPVCYVLPSRSLADLLVVDHACEKAQLHRPYDPLNQCDMSEGRSFYFLAHAEGRIFKRPSLRAHSARIQRLLERHESDPDLEVQLVPVSLFWGHAPEHEKSLFKLLLSDTWSATRRFKKFLAVLIQPGHIVVHFSPPISLRDLTDGEADGNLRLRKLSRLLRVHFRRRKQAIIGPDLSHRRTMLNSLLSSTTVRDSIAAEARDRGVPEHRVGLLAHKYAREIAADQSFRVVRLLYRLLTWFWHKLYRGFVISNIERVQEIAQVNEVVYIPSHRSHIDYLVLSYLLYQNGLSLPHIAAGKNMNMPLVGPLLRRGGAFFMRRTFQDDQLYKTVFDEYLHMTFTKGHPVEYFIEGGRSRTGRMLQPRTGMLSMTIRSFQRKSSPPIVFMPVHFGYERILEGATYINELRGAEKRDESLADIFRVLKFLKLEFGKVYVNFGEPLYLADFLDQHLPGWESPGATQQDDFHDACSRLAHRLAVSINQAVAVTPVNLLAIILLATAKQRVTERTLRKQIDLFRDLMLLRPYSKDVTVTELPADEIISHGEKMSLFERVTEPLDEVLSAQGDPAVLLTYYRNNVAHVLALPSLIARFVTKHSERSRKQVYEDSRVLYPFMSDEYFLHWGEDEVEQVCSDYLSAMSTLGLLSTEDESIATPAPGTDCYGGLLALAEIIEPTLQRFFITGSLLNRADSIPLTSATLELACRQVGQTIASVHGLNAPEFFQPSLFTTFLSGLVNVGAVTVDGEVLLATERLPRVLSTIEPLVDSEVRQGILEAVTRFTFPVKDGTHQTG